MTTPNRDTPAPISEALAFRIIDQAEQFGALVLTLSEYRTVLAHVGKRDTVIVGGRPLVIRRLPVSVLPDTPEQLPELDQWRNMLHASHAEGLIDHDDMARLWNR